MFLLLFGSLAINFCRQIILQNRANKRLAIKERELAELQEKNRWLKEELGETGKAEFLEQQAAKLFSMTKDGKPILLEESVSGGENLERELNLKIPNYLKWWKLFWK